MSEKKHTPGPWEAVNGTVVAENGSVFGIADCYAATVGPNWSGTDYSGERYQLANARLIAAAPELLEALQAVLREAVILSADYLEAFRDLPDDAVIQGWDKARWKAALAAEEKARIAIAKATGAQS